MLLLARRLERYSLQRRFYEQANLNQEGRLRSCGAEHPWMWNIQIHRTNVGSGNREICTVFRHDPMARRHFQGTYYSDHRWTETLSTQWVRTEN